jgi:hypothetical protein
LIRTDAYGRVQRITIIEGDLSGGVAQRRRYPHPERTIERVGTPIPARGPREPGAGAGRVASVPTPVSDDSSP